jgi:hypothetical protein
MVASSGSQNARKAIQKYGFLTLRTATGQLENKLEENTVSRFCGAKVAAWGWRSWVASMQCQITKNQDSWPWVACAAAWGCLPWVPNMQGKTIGILWFLALRGKLLPEAGFFGRPEFKDNVWKIDLGGATATWGWPPWVAMQALGILRPEGGLRPDCCLTAVSLGDQNKSKTIRKLIFWALAGQTATWGWIHWAARMRAHR